MGRRHYHFTDSPQNNKALSPLQTKWMNAKPLLHMNNNHYKPLSPKWIKTPELLQREE
jgi:hypothetical protein